MRGEQALGVILAAGLASCALGPGYHQPATPASAAGPFASVAAPATVSEAPPPNWWRLYDDPILDGLVGQALTENASLKVAAANLLRALGVLEQAKAGRFPTTTLQAGEDYGRSSTAELIAQLKGAEAKPAWLFNGSFDVAYEVDLFGRIRRTIEAAREDAAATAEAEDATRVAVAAQTAQAYADACAYAEAAQVARDSADVARQILDLTRKQRDLGSRSDFDVASAAAVYDQQEAAVPTLEGQWRAQLYALAVLTGRPPAEISTAAAGCKTPPKIDRPLPVGDGAALLQRRPDVRQAEHTLAADTARIGVAMADFFPTVSLTGNIATGGSGFRQVFSARSLTYQLGPLITWSFPNTLVARAEVIQARAQASADIAQFDAVVLEALKEAEQALTAYGAELTRHASLTANRDDNQRAFDLAQIQLTNGAIAFPDLLQTERNLIAARSELAQSDLAMADDQVAVFQALGGGWEAAPLVAPPKSP